MKTEIFIAERDRVNDALRESEQRYKRLLAATTDYIYTVNIEHGLSRSTYHGPGCEAVTGYSPADFANDPYLWYRIIYDEDRPAVLAQVDRIMHGEQPPPLEHRIICRDGSLRWIRNTTIPHYDEQGTLAAYDGLISDITGRKQADQALRESEERLALVIRGSNDGIWDWNITTNETYFSPRWKSMLGYEDHEIENHFSSWEQLIHPDDRVAASARLRAYFAGELPVYELEHRLRHKDGSYRWILARGVVLRDSNGKPVRMAGSHLDVTELKNAAERLKQANLELKETQGHLIQAARFESIGTLAAGVAHEVKNPLQTILMGLYYLSQKLVTPDDGVALALSDMRESVNRANAIVGDLLTLAKVTQFQLKSDNLNEIIQHCLRLLHNQLDAAGITAAVSLSQDLSCAQMDKSRIEQVFLNLFVNSIQAMPAGGTLTVTTRTLVLDGDATAIPPLYREFKAGERLIVAEVRDTGTGIKETDLPKVFDPFFTTKPVGVGTGLGLSMAKMIIDRHGGVVAIKNAEGGGVLVTVALKAG
jgi:two-component system, sensor histidine kinase and response regulator